MQPLWDWTIWMLGTLALAIAVFFWIEVANEGQSAFLRNPKASLIALGKSTLWFVLLVGVVWGVTRGS